MSRPIRPRKISYQSDINYFKPAGVPLRELEEVILTHDETEALRLKDVEGLDQENCAQKMGVSQPTFFRVLKNARKKSSDAIVNGKAIRIEGGTFEFQGKFNGTIQNMNLFPNRGRGFGRGNGRESQ